MTDSKSKLGSCTDSKTQAEWDVDSITEQIMSDMNGAFTRSTVQEVLKEIVPNYEDARIQSFVPIFVRRDVVNRLRAMQAPIASPGIKAAAASSASRTSPDPASSSNADDEQDTTIDSGFIHLNPAT